MLQFYEEKKFKNEKFDGNHLIGVTRICKMKYFPLLHSYL